MCVFAGLYTHSSQLHLPANVICVIRSHNKTILSLYQVDVQTKYARNEKHFNSTKRNNIKGRIRATYYWYYNTRSNPADVKQNKRSRVYHRKFKTLATTYRMEMIPILEIIQTLSPKPQDYFLKVQYFCNSSLVSQSIHPRSRRGAQRMTKGEGRWSRPPKTFTCFIRSSPADVKQTKQTLKPCRHQATQTLESMLPQNSKHYNYRLEMMPIL